VSADDPVEIPIDGILDLHAFDPKDVKDLIPEYIEECLRKGITELRIVHGKGTGTLKAVVRGLLEKNPRVADFKDAGMGAGGWGATTVRLKRRGQDGVKPTFYPKMGKR
jgi:dsDNA-specific endonuclease/ATPase MutS2